MLFAIYLPSVSSLLLPQTLGVPTGDISMDSHETNCNSELYYLMNLKVKWANYS
ncbi:hypothetical protein CY34DRAFT_194032 [Suillus luteus UH-Slu-Lm8-n1]|uniref:Uncharacterized protein n=1 Tax=Suillus luteus UH-Slu-Lm8-n1 TaxID=930992 RepID=A0A0D0BEC5_9AGAM|nr:hypothetical protein CY34DRAFT_194032 [Suillus luteus UH-Slu-Lm8-n1]